MEITSSVLDTLGRKPAHDTLATSNVNGWDERTILGLRRSGWLPRGPVGATPTFFGERGEEGGWASGEVHGCPFPNASLQTRRANFSAPGFPASSGWSCP